MGLQSTLPHSDTHATGGQDELTPARIGAAPAAHDHDNRYYTETEIDTKLDGKASLDAGTGKILSTQLPSYVDDVIEFEGAVPATGETGKIYVSHDNGKCYRWSGSTFVEISASPGSTDSVTEGTLNLYHTTARASAAAPVQSVAGKTGVVSLAVGDVSGLQTALDGKQAAGSYAAASHTHDDRYYTEAEAEAVFAGNNTKQLSAQQYFDPQGGWVQVASFPTAGLRHMVEFGAFISDDARNQHSTIKLLFVLDGYDNSGYSESYFPVSQISRHAGEVIVAARVRYATQSPPSPICLDLKFTSSGVTSQYPTGTVRIVSWAKVYHRDAVYSQCIPNLTVVAAPDTTGHVMGPEFMPGNGILEKLTAGDYASGREGATVANRVDNTIKTFHKGVWNQIFPHVTSYNQLTDKPALGTAAATAASDYATAAQGAKADSALQPDTAIAAASLEVGVAAGGTADLYVGGDGKVGIGTEAPTERLSVVGNIRATGNIVGAISIVSVNADYVLHLSDACSVISVTAGATISVPLDSAAAFPIGTQILLTKTTASPVVVAPATAGVTINAPGGASEIASRYGMAVLLKVETDSWILGGDII